MGVAFWIVMLRSTGGADARVASPAWSARIVQVPTLTVVRAPALVIVQTSVVTDANVTASVGTAFEVAVSVGVAPKLCGVVGWLKVMVCEVTLVRTVFEGAEPRPVSAVGVALFFAVTVNVYAVPVVNPLTVHGEAAQVPDRLPGFETAVYWVMGAPPPSDAGAVNAMLAEVSPEGVPSTFVGAPGAVATIVMFLVDWVASGCVVLPAWSAATVQVPCSTGVTTPADVTVQVEVVVELNVGAGEFPAEDVALSCPVLPYVIVEGAVKVVKVGFAAGVTLFEAADSALSPVPLVACTVNV